MSALLLFHATSALVLLGLAVALVRVQPLVALAAVALLTISATDAIPVPLVTLRGLSVYSADVCAAVLAAGALLRLGDAPSGLRRVVVPASVLTVVTALNLLRGLGPFGSSAITQARPLVYLLATTAYFLTLGPAWHDRLLRYVTAVALGLTALAAWRWAGQGLGGADELVLTDGVRRTTRVLLASQAVVVAAAALLALWRWTEHGRARDLLAAGTFLGTVTVAQHRTVWVGTVVGLAVVLLVVRPALRLRFAALAVGGLVLLVPVLLSGLLSPVTERLLASASTASLDAGTFGWRLEGWRQLLAAHADGGMLAFVMGEPFGAPQIRILDGQVVAVSAHSFYVSTYLRGGVLGLGALTVLVWSWRRLRDPALLSIAALLATYSLAYSIDVFAAPLVALLLLSASSDPAAAVAPRGALAQDDPDPGPPRQRAARALTTPSAKRRTISSTV